MEVCNIVNGQQAYCRLTDQQTADMIKYTAVKPEGRFRKIEEIVSSFIISFVFYSEISYCPIALQVWINNCI